MTITRRIKSILKEDAPAVSGGGGNVAGIGVGVNGEPGGKRGKLIRRSKFAGQECFEVNSDVFDKSKFGKDKYKRYKSYVGECDTGNAIRDYGRKNPKKAIVIKNELTGAMLYLKYGKK